MDVRVDVRKTVTESAQEYYGKAKKARAKIPGIEKSIKDTKRYLENIDASILEEEAKNNAPLKNVLRERKWFEKFRWFNSSDGFLVIGGRDATSNEIVVKKHTSDSDILFHADISGAPFFVVKNPDRIIVPETTLLEVAEASASYSSGWKRGLGAVDVYHVSPEQVSKTPMSGEYLAKGSFVVRGARNWHRKTELKVAVGLRREDGLVVGGPINAVSAQCSVSVSLKPGDRKQGEISKNIALILTEKNDGETRINSSDVQSFVPAGKSNVIK